jgi:hypothetical protein
VYRHSCWEPSQSGMSQPRAADRAEQPLTPDTQVATASWDQLEHIIYLVVDVSRCGSGIFWLSESQHFEYVSTDSVRVGNV